MCGFDASSLLTSSVNAKLSTAIDSDQRSSSLAQPTDDVPFEVIAAGLLRRRGDPDAGGANIVRDNCMGRTSLGKGT